VARAWLREGLEPGSAGDGPVADASPASATGTATGSAAQLSPAARVWVRRLYTSPNGRDLVAMDSRRRVFGGLLRRMLVLRDDVCTTPWCEAPIVQADHATPVREHGGTSYTEGNGKCTRCNYGKEAPGWRTRVILTATGFEVIGRAGSSCGDSSSGDSSGGDSSGDAGCEDGPRASRVVQVTTPLGHRYESEPPPLLGWGSLPFPPPGSMPSRPEVPLATNTAPVVPSPTSGPEVPPAASDTTLEPILAPGPNPKPTRPRQVAARRAQVDSGRPHPGHRRKRPLLRARQLPTGDTRRLQRRRRPRLTSHLERELCRYLT
jgi:hypothetical protein